MRGEAQDELHSRVAIIDQTMARHYFASRDPIGKNITLFHVTGDPEPMTYEVIGVTGDANYLDIREPQRSGIYLPAFHDGVVGADNLALRTDVDAESVAGDVRAATNQAMKNVAILRITTLNA